MFGLGQWEILGILFVILLLFGPKRLPQLGKSLGKTVRALREGAEGKLNEEEEEEEASPKKSAASKPKAKAAESAPEEGEDEEE